MRRRSQVYRPDSRLFQPVEALIHNLYPVRPPGWAPGRGTGAEIGMFVNEAPEYYGYYC